jgi:hypothetical protein
MFSSIGFYRCLSDTLNLLPQFPGGHEIGTLSPNDHLLYSIGSCHQYAVFFMVIMDEFLYILVCSLCLLGIDYMDVMMIDYSLYIPGDTVCIKYKDDLTSSNPLVVAQDVLQFCPGYVHMFIHKIIKLWPCMDDIIAVHQKVLLLRLLMSPYRRIRPVIAYPSRLSLFPG